MECPKEGPRTYSRGTAEISLVRIIYLMGRDLDNQGKIWNLPRERFFWIFKECDGSYRSRLLAHIEKLLEVQP